MPKEVEEVQLEVWDDDGGFCPIDKEVTICYPNIVIEQSDGFSN